MPRKSKDQSVDDTIINVKKRRGRKPKEEVLSENINTSEEDQHVEQLVNLIEQLDTTFCSSELEPVEQKEQPDTTSCSTELEPTEQSDTTSCLTPVEQHEPKKRGRKPKQKDPEDDKPKEQKKRGRKPKDKVYTVNTVPIAPKFNFADDNIILHIPLQDNDLIEHEQQTFGDKEFFDYNPNICEPKPYDSYDDAFAPLKGNANEPFERIEETKSSNDEYRNISKVNISMDLSTVGKTKQNDESSVILPMTDEPLQKEFNESPRVSKRKIHNIMFEFIDKKQKDYWPERTDVYCYWCCHGFNTRPLGMPVKHKNGKFLLSRNYCSWNCMIAHLFQMKEYDMYEKYQLINYMYSKIYDCPPVKIRPAPAREVLKVFGGILSIEEFRESALLLNKTYEVMYPPMTSMIPQIEECIMEISANKKKDKNFVPVDQNLLDRVQRTLKLKRDKPLVNSKHTLESYMDIKVI